MLIDNLLVRIDQIYRETTTENIQFSKLYEHGYQINPWLDKAFKGTVVNLNWYFK